MCIFKRYTFFENLKNMAPKQTCYGHFNFKLSKGMAGFSLSNTLLIFKNDSFFIDETMILFSFLIFHTKNLQLKKSQFSLSDLPHQAKDITPPRVKSFVWWGKAEKENQFFFYCGFLAQIIKNWYQYHLFIYKNESFLKIWRVWLILKVCHTLW